MKKILKDKKKIIIICLLILLIVLIIAICYKVSKNRNYKIHPESNIYNITMDNNDIIFSVQYIDNKFYEVEDNIDYNIKISNMKLQYSDLSETIYESNQIVYSNNTNMNNNVLINLSNNKLEIKFHIRKNNLKQVEKLNLFIGKIEIYTDKDTIIFDKEQNISINIPEDSYNRNIKIYKAKYANDESVDLGNLSFIVNKDYSTTEINFINSSIKETMSEYNEGTSIEDNLAIKNNSYIRDEKFNKYYQVNRNDSNNGYHISKEGYLLKCWRTFELPIDKATNILTIHLFSNNKNIIITLED